MSDSILRNSVFGKPEDIGLSIPTEFDYDFSFNWAIIDLFGVQIIQKTDTDTTYEAIVFDYFENIENFTQIIVYADGVCSGIIESNIKVISDTCIHFKLKKTDYVFANGIDYRFGLLFPSKCSWRRAQSD